MLKIKLCRSRNHTADKAVKFLVSHTFADASDGTWNSNQDDSTCKLMLVDTCFRIFDNTKQHKTDLYKNSLTALEDLDLVLHVVCSSDGSGMPREGSSASTSAVAP